MAVDMSPAIWNKRRHPVFPAQSRRTPHDACDHPSAINDPYKGGALTERTARPAANRHSLQIEVNRALTMNEATFQKSTHFDKARSDLGQFIERLGASLDHALRVAEEGTVLGA